MKVPDLFLDTKFLPSNNTISTMPTAEDEVAEMGDRGGESRGDNGGEVGVLFALFAVFELELVFDLVVIH